MGSNEEYLDDLLKSIMESEVKSDPPEDERKEGAETITEDEFSLDDFAIQESDIDDASVPNMDFEDDIMFSDMTDITSGDEDDIMLADMADITFGDEDDAMFSDMTDITFGNESDVMFSDMTDITSDNGDDGMLSDIADIMSADEVEAMFAAADAVGNDDEDVENENSESEIVDNSEYIDSEDSEDAVSEDIAGIDAFFPSDSEDMGADEMLALLESMSSDIEEEERTSSGHEDSTSMGTEKDSDQNDGKKVKEKKGIFSGIFGKKNDKDKKQDDEESSSQSDNEEEAEQPDDKPAKKRNFIINALSFLTESDESGDGADKLKAEHGMELSDENRNILEELDAEDKKKKKKKAKGKKETASEDESEIEEKKDKKKKEPKKAKVVNEENPEVTKSVKPGKKISVKNITIITALCLTLMALIIVLVSVVPLFFEKREARDAYYEADYAKSYELLYGKQLDDSDTIIYNKSKIILSLNRKLSSYHSYMSMGKELQALDALMSGIEKYPKILADAEEYNVINEVDAIYATILNILSDKYDISEEVAKVIVSYDDLTYTRKLESIVYRTPFILPGEENMQDEEAEESTSIPDDILPEERGIIGESNPAARADSEQITLEDMPADIPYNEVQETDNSADIADQITDIAETVPDVQSDESYGNQGQLIQGIRQPVDIKIKGN